MGRLIDVSSRKFKYITVLNEFLIKENSSGYKTAYWKVRCKCSREIWVAARQLLGNRIKSCGCVHFDTIKKKQLKLEERLNDCERRRFE